MEVVSEDKADGICKGVRKGGVENMNEAELMLKELRVSVWEQTKKVLEMPEMTMEGLDVLNVDESTLVVGDLFEFKQDNHGNFLLINNRPLSI